MSTASAASSVQPPAKTDSRRNTACSLGVSRSWLQAMALRIVRRRSGTSRRSPLRRANRLASLASRACGGRTFDPCRGQLDRQGQAIQPDAELGDRRRVVLRQGEVGATARARWRNSAMASYPANSVSESACAGSGSASGGTGNSCSPAMRNDSRLVTSSVSLGQCARRSAKLRRGVDHLLEIVEQQEHGAIAQRGREEIRGRLAAHLEETQGLGNRSG